MTARILTGKVLSAGEIEKTLSAFRLRAWANDFDAIEATLRAYGAVVEAARVLQAAERDHGASLRRQLKGDAEDQQIEAERWATHSRVHAARAGLNESLRSLPEGEKERG